MTNQHTRRWRVRRMNHQDAPEVARWIPALQPVPLALADALPQLLRELFKGEEITGVCVEEDNFPVSPWRSIGIGLSTFISDPQATTYLANPVPRLNLTLLDRERTHSEERGILGLEEVARNNAAAGLNLLILYWIHEHGNYDFSDPRIRALFVEGQKILHAFHRGYNLKLIICETWAETRDAVLSVGLKESRAFPAGTPMTFPGVRSDRHLILTGLSREEARKALPGSPASLLFEYTRPLCLFSRGEQWVLECVLNGMTDEQIAQALEISRNGVKRRWGSIFSRMQANGLLFEDDQSIAAAVPPRGPEKRRPALEYIRDHLEELRPYDP